MALARRSIGLAAAMVVGVFFPAAQARGDDWTRTPYRLTVAVHVDEHPLHTEAFVSRLHKEIAAAVQRELGSAVEVEVAATHVLLDEVLKHGWEVLDRPQALDEAKVHLLRVSQADGQYLVQGRQVDGWTGIVSPLRTERTADRRQVSRRAAELVLGDFGVVGRVTGVNNKVVSLTLKAAGGPDAAPALHVEPGEVFALAQIQQGRDRKQQAFRVPDAILYVVRPFKDGQYETRLFERYQDSLAPDRNTVEFRAIRLGTVKTSPRVRMVDAQDGKPLKNIGVAFSSNGEFDAAPGGDRCASDEQGWAQSRRVYAHVVFVQPTIAGQVRAAIPVPLVDDRPIEIRLTGTREAEEFAQFQYRYLQWEKKVVALRSQVDKEVKEITALDRSDKEKQAAEKAASLAGRLSDDVGARSKELDAVKKTAQGAGPAAENLIARGERHLAALTQQLKNLQEYVQFVENPTAAQKLIKQARLLEETGEAVQAMEIYRKAADIKDDRFAADASRRLKVLEEAWRIKSVEHRKARDWMNNLWGPMDWEKLEKGLSVAEEALVQFEKAGDFLSARRLAKFNTQHLEKLSEVFGTLSPQTSAADDAKAKQIARTAEGIARLNHKIVDFLAKAEKN